MANIRAGYYRIPAVEIGATLIFVPAYSRGICVLELAVLAKQHGYGDIAYIAARSKPRVGVEA